MLLAQNAQKETGPSKASIRFTLWQVFLTLWPTLLAASVLAGALTWVSSSETTPADPVSQLVFVMLGGGLGVVFVMCVSVFLRCKKQIESVNELGFDMVNVIRTHGGKVGADAPTYEEFPTIYQQLKDQLEQRSQVVEETESWAAEMAMIMEKLGGGLRNLSAGDLESQIHEPMGEDYEQLRRDFNRTVDALANIIAELSESAASIDEDATILSEGADNLSQRTENQAATLEQTAAAMEEITSSVTATANGAREIVLSIAVARDKAEQGEAVRSRAVAAMGAIEQSSKKIGQIIQVMEEIAFQTNLLSLNAGVEAARAGEVGRGFAVVAAEVRALAQRSSQSASEIRELIEESNDNVSNGVHLVSDMGAAIEDILLGVTQVTDRVAEIATGATEQADGLSEINNGITSLDQVTQQNAAMVGESAAASRALREKAVNLRALVMQFQMRNAADIEKAPASIQLFDDWGEPEPDQRRATGTGGELPANTVIWQDF